VYKLLEVFSGGLLGSAIVLWAMAIKTRFRTRFWVLAGSSFTAIGIAILILTKWSTGPGPLLEQARGTLFFTPLLAAPMVVSLLILRKRLGLWHILLACIAAVAVNALLLGLYWLALEQFGTPLWAIRYPGATIFGILIGPPLALYCAYKSRGRGRHGRTT
jgi:hypothetical protein